MPPAKKPSTSTRRRASSSPAATPKITRKEVEQATERFEKALEDANHALQAIGQDLGKGARQAYKDLAASLKTLRQNARKTNRGVVKDLDKLVAAVTAGKATSRPARKPARKPAARAASKPAARAASKPASRAASKPAARAASKPASRGASKPASRAASKPAAGSAAKKPTRSRRST